MFLHIIERKVDYDAHDPRLKRSLAPPFEAVDMGKHPDKTILNDVLSGVSVGHIAMTYGHGSCRATVVQLSHGPPVAPPDVGQELFLDRSEEHTSELQSRQYL